MTEKASIFLVDDHKIVRDGIKSLLIGNRDFLVAGEAGDGRQLLKLLEKGQPDILVLDLGLPDISGLELIKQVTSKYKAVKVLILSAEIAEDVILQSVKNGASGFLHKDVNAKEFSEALRLVFEGECYFGQSISGIIYKSYRKKIQGEAETLLSEREIEIISLLSDGLSFKEIGMNLNISPRTVENHKSRILEKLELKNTIELVKYAIKNKLITLN